MIWVDMILGLFVAAVICLLVAKLKIIIEYQQGKLKIVFRSLFFSYTLDEKKLNRFSSKSESSEKKTEVSKAMEDGVEGFVSKVKSLKGRFARIKNIVTEVLEYLGPRTELSDMLVKSEFGTGDAAKTGMICGAVWALIGNAYAFLCRFFNIEFPDIQLSPIFDKKCFNIEACGIIKIRPVHIITAAIRGFKVYDKHKQEKGVDNNGRTASDSGLDVHSDAEY